MCYELFLPGNTLIIVAIFMILTNNIYLLTGQTLSLNHKLLPHIDVAVK